MLGSCRTRLCSLLRPAGFFGGCPASLPRRERILRLHRACSVAPPRDADIVLLFSIPYLAVVLHPTESLAPHGADHGEVAGLSLAYVIRRCLVRIQVVRRLEVYTPGALLAQGGEPMREMAVRVPAKHEADDALIVRDLPYRVQ